MTRAPIVPTVNQAEHWIDLCLFPALCGALCAAVLSVLFG